MKTAELTGTALDWVVAKCEGWLDEADNPDDGLEFLESVYEHGNCHYSTEWAQGGPIIEREGISTYHTMNGSTLYWVAEVYGGNTIFKSEGHTPIIAAMRCYVASKLGDDVEIPEELK